MTTALLVAALAISASADAGTGATVQDLTASEQRQVERVCKNVDEDHKERCVIRQIARMRRSSKLSNPVNANDIRDAMDIGRNHQRGRYRRTRLEEAFERVQTRRTFRQDPNQQNSILHPDYLSFVRAERLRCMAEVSVGRARAMCLDNLAQTARDRMKEVNENRTYPATEQ